MESFVENMKRRQYSTEFKDWLNKKGAKMFMFFNLFKQEHIELKSNEVPFELFAKFYTKSKTKAMSCKSNFIIALSSDSESNSSDDQVNSPYYIFDLRFIFKKLIILLILLSSMKKGSPKIRHVWSGHKCY